MVQTKKCITKEDVLEAVNERDVKFIRTQFTDTLGIIKSWAIPVEQLEEAFENGVMFDGSSIQGFTKIEESDMLGKFEDLIGAASEMGLKAYLLDAGDVPVENRVALKCAYGCKGYGCRLSCPPYIMSIDDFKKVIKEYSSALLLVDEHGSSGRGCCYWSSYPFNLFAWICYTNALARVLGSLYIF